MLACFTRGFPLFSGCDHTACLLLSRCASRGQGEILGALDLHQIAAIPEPLPVTGIVIGVQARNTLMTGLLEPLDPPGPAKAGVLQDQ